LDNCAIKLAAPSGAASFLNKWQTWIGPACAGTNNRQANWIKAPSTELFLSSVIAMKDKAAFFQKETEECVRIAAGAIKKKDRDFWLGLAQRWDGLLKPTSTPDEADRSLRFDRPIRQRRKFAFAKRRAA